ncbi:ABC transporter substrate-binding protein [Nocardioides sp. cx-173]|uniref:ABC transporter substrate-binding protein n=1 Tax=Nocardioides sp. cx-173 TaxID=2898796 RepID=UPI001E44ECC5|nr:ABC transporter substrate-binding protein [Nocardioides sp. cx-173]MCD4524231.1 ABC transporter substrate-binding protein [Nocardioides sp. cx-173]UGB41623.1 ABC transporter substrate-binding protein [Nocardioides sp. cx-173]
MSPHPSRLRLLATAATVSLLLAACGGGGSDGDGRGGAEGEPVAGGSLAMIAPGEPRGLDPAVMQNAWSANAAVGAALYGALLETDITTGEVTPSLAESWETTDHGKTFTLTLREGTTFSDGTPFDAAAVKFNWDRLKDPAVAPLHATVANMIATNEVIDATTLEVTMVSPIPQFAQGIATSGLTWIASPKALEAGTDAFNTDPVGAGPFTLVDWTPNDVMELEKNDKYFEGPDKPYLDELTIRTITDTNQRYNTLASGGADVIVESNRVTQAKLEDEGKVVERGEFSGGNYLRFNTLKPPFDDVRARQAVAAAFDYDQANQAMSQGKAQQLHTLFSEKSPFYSAKELDGYDPERAQELFDELAAEGKPVEFTFTGWGSFETTTLGENLITQLSQYDNVSVEMQDAQMADIGRVLATGDFQVVVHGVPFSGDPDPLLWVAWHSDSVSNAALSDPIIDKALDEGRLATTVEDRKAAYDRLQDQLIASRPMVFTEVPVPSLISNTNVGGLSLCCWGAPRVADLWITD